MQANVQQQRQGVVMISGSFPLMLTVPSGADLMVKATGCDAFVALEQSEGRFQRLRNGVVVNDGCTTILTYHTEREVAVFSVFDDEPTLVEWWYE
jgi:hypothetical protein